MLWFVVGFRLLCPFELQSSFSVFNLTPVKKVVETTNTQNANYMRNLHRATERRIATPNQATESNIKEVSDVKETATGISSAQVLLIIWLAGVAMILGYTIYKYVKLLRCLRGAKQIEERIYESPLITAPFVLGVRNPRIYLPVDVDEQEKKYLVLHEQVHIQYGDYFMKCVGFFAATVHWFNPLVWLAYLLYSKDVEMRCDEVVIDKLGYCIKKDYSLSLVSYASKKKNMTYVVMPLSFSNKGFGGMEVKMRIKNILSYKKASKIAAALAIVSVGGVTVFCASNAKEADKNAEAKETLAVESTTEATTEAENTTKSVATEATDNDYTVPSESGESFVMDASDYAFTDDEIEEMCDSDEEFAVQDKEGNELYLRYGAKKVVDEKSGEEKIQYFKIVNERKGIYEDVSADSLDPKLKAHLDYSVMPEKSAVENTAEEKAALAKYEEKFKAEGYFVSKDDWSFEDKDYQNHDYKGLFVSDTNDGKNTIAAYVVAMNEEEFQKYMESQEEFYTFEKTENGYRSAGVNGMSVKYDIEYHADEHILVEFYDIKDCHAEG